MDWLVWLLVSWPLAILVLVAWSRYQWRRRVLADPNTIIQEVNGTRYVVSEKQHAVVKNKKSGRRGALLNAGWERVPHMQADELILKHRWLRILPLGNAGSAGAPRWVIGRDWELAGTTSVKWLHRL